MSFFALYNPNTIMTQALKSGMMVAILLAAQLTLAASREEKLVTRVDTVAAVLKHRTVSIRATGMARTPTAMGRGAWLVHRGQPGVLNKDGLLEYNMVFNAVPGYAGFKLKPVTAKLNDRSAPPGLKGVRIFSEFNQYDGLLPEPKKKKPFSLNPFGKKKRDESEETTQ